MIHSETVPRHSGHPERKDPDDLQGARYGEILEVLRRQSHLSVFSQGEWIRFVTRGSMMESRWHSPSPLALITWYFAWPAKQGPAASGSN